MTKNTALNRTAAGLARAEIAQQSFRPKRGEAAGLRTFKQDLVVVEEPLQMLIAGEPLGVTLRTPGHDHELTAGYLLAEGIIASAKDLGSIRHCGRADTPQNTIDVLPAPGCVMDPDLFEARAGTWSSSACGLCGRRQIDDLLARCASVTSDLQVSARSIQRATRELARGQLNFSRTGGCHAAGIANAQGEFQLIREDVGRHNAVDKVIGRLLLDNTLPAAQRMLVVSGRVSFEIVQKAVAAGLPIIVGVSAPSSLAITTAQRAGLCLIGFSREASFNIYAGEGRVSSGFLQNPA